MPEIQGTIADHLKRMGADDISGVAQSRHMTQAGRTMVQSKTNPAVGVLIENGQRHVLYGLGDPNFSPARLSYDTTGKIDSVRINNSDRSGHVTYRAEAPVVDAIIKAASGKPSGRGYAVAALAKASGATNKFGDSRWGVGLIQSAEAMDTKLLSSSHHAIGCVQAKWQDFVKPLETPKPQSFQRPGAPKM